MYNVSVIGGGLIGLATARELLLRGVRRVAVFEAEHAVAQHQSGRNSGVVHAGIYYKPGSQKAKLCVEGLRASYDYFKQKDIPHRKVGKLIVALNDSEVSILQSIYRNALENDVPHLSFLDSNRQIQVIEPECAGVAAIHSPETGIVDWGVVAHHYAVDIRSLGGTVYLNHRVVGLDSSGPVRISVETGRGTHRDLKFILSDRVVTCAGAYSDRIAQFSGGSRQPQIIPIRGEYLRLSERAAGKIRGNIYPVPNPNVPFLGVHFTPTMRGDVIVGPNAVLAFARDGYDYSTVRFGDVWQSLSNTGFWKLVMRHGVYAVGEMYRSIFLRSAAHRARRYIPSLSVSDFSRVSADRNGVRGQAVDGQGHLLDDFLFEQDAHGRILHIRNAPSPGATSSIPIGRTIADRLLGS